MSRPIKTGLDYFPLDVDMAQDDKIFYIETKHGPTGFAVIVRLFMRIYRNGYYCEWSQKQQLMFSRKVNVDINTLSEIVNDCINEGLFNKNVYNKHSVLTSNGIQIRYLEACKRRTEVEIDARYLLADTSNYSNIVIVNTNPSPRGVIVDINARSEVVNAELTTQSKVKESRGKESKEEEGNLTPSESKYISILQRVDNYPLDIDTDVQYFHTLQERYPDTDILACVQEWSDYKLDHPLKNKSSPRSQIGNWCKKDAEEFHKHTKKQRHRQLLI